MTAGSARMDDPGEGDVPVEIRSATGTAGWVYPAASARAPRIGPQLAAALARAQGSFRTIKAERKARVQGETRQGRRYDYEYHYADLSAVLEAVRPALAENELALVQLPTVRIHEGATFVRLETLLSHSSGEYVSTDLEIPSEPTTQSIGSTITYARRYSLLCLLGVAAEDDDGVRGQGPPQGGQGGQRSQGPARSSGSGEISDGQARMIWARCLERAHAAGEKDEEPQKELARKIRAAALEPAGVTHTKSLRKDQVDDVLARIRDWEPEARHE